MRNPIIAFIGAGMNNPMAGAGGRQRGMIEKWSKKNPSGLADGLSIDILWCCIPLA